MVPNSRTYARGLINGVPPFLEVMGNGLCLIAFHFKFDCGIGTGSGFVCLCASLAKEGQPLGVECCEAFVVSMTLELLTGQFAIDIFYAYKPMTDMLNSRSRIPCLLTHTPSGHLCL